MYKGSKNHIHLIGIGGIGMSGLAELLINLGYQVSGSDISESDSVKKLRDLGADIKIGHHPENIKNQEGGFCDVVVRSTAIDASNPEILSATEARVRVIRRADLLADLMHMKFGIAVAGTHGKTTTSSLVASTLIHAGLDPTVVIGGKVANIGGNAKLGKGKFLVAEADESDGSFLLLSPAILVVTNIDDDHLDYYRNFEGIKSAFLQFIEKTPFYGQAILCLDDPVVREILPSVRAPHTTYGFSEKADWRGENLHSEICGGVLGTSFEVIFNDKNLGKVFLPCSGRHNVLNALATIAVSAEAQIPIEKIFEGLQKFKGVQRRLEKKANRDRLHTFCFKGGIP
jgi:UDP-N-acetylmuramate--alanine ligase